MASCSFDKVQELKLFTFSEFPVLFFLFAFLSRCSSADDNVSFPLNLYNKSLADTKQDEEAITVVDSTGQLCN